jgi:hypothetical protein
MRIITGTGLYKLFNPSKEISNIIIYRSISTWKEAIKVNTTRPFCFASTSCGKAGSITCPMNLIYYRYYTRGQIKDSHEHHILFSIKRKCTKYPRLLQSQKMLYGYQTLWTKQIFLLVSSHVF